MNLVGKVARSYVNAGRAILSVSSLQLPDEAGVAVGEARTENAGVWRGCLLASPPYKSYTRIPPSIYQVWCGEDDHEESDII